jgi:hypothetical protein
MRIEGLQPLLLTQPRLPGRVDRVRESQPIETTGTQQPVDELILSPEVQAAAAYEETAEDEQPRGEETTSGTKGKAEADPKAAEDAKPSDSELSEEEQEQVTELRQRDQQVRAHEQAHVAAAGQYARGGPSFTYQRGPDGQRYAIGGEVQIDTSAIPGDPEATIQKARVIRAAASAPAEPSSQDRAVAAAATKLEAQARQEQARAQYEPQAPQVTFDVKA